MVGTHVTFQIHLRMEMWQTALAIMKSDTGAIVMPKQNFTLFFPDQVGCDKDPKIVIIVTAATQRDKQLTQKKKKTKQQKGKNKSGNFRVVCSGLCDGPLKPKSSSSLSKSNVWNWSKQVYVKYTTLLSVRAPPDEEVVEILKQRKSLITIRDSVKWSNWIKQICHFVSDSSCLFLSLSLPRFLFCQYCPEAGNSLWH